MKNKNCGDLRDLEERLACLQEKYEDLTNQLEEERLSGMISDETWSYQELLTERQFVKKQIDLIQKRIVGREKFMSKKCQSDTVEIGKCVRLQNHSGSMEVCLVSTDDANPAKGHISSQSPIGKAIEGKKIGDEVIVSLPKGEIPYIIEKFI
ncbi:MAG: GreA/GreB family elongation factor [Candidatus Dojkabacteria bacterium]|nr:GreA/GreB family elongation factor [Candidatus Dojkabacteria bacterium]